MERFWRRTGAGRKSVSDGGAGGERGIDGVSGRRIRDKTAVEQVWILYDRPRFGGVQHVSGACVSVGVRPVVGDVLQRESFFSGESFAEESD